MTSRKDRRADVVARDKRYVWHPYTPMQEYVEHGDPLVVVRAEGSRLHDADGRSFLDGNSSWWTALLGHNHPRLVAALVDQASRFSHVALAGITHEPAVDLAERLVQVAPPGLAHVFYSDNGSTAVEVGIKLSVQYWAQNGRPERTRFLSLEGAFHGETLGVTALGAVAAFHSPFQKLVMPTTHLPSPAFGEERTLDALERALRDDSDRIAALVVEPLVQGAGGMRMHSPDFLREARALTSRHDVFLLVDEVFTGYGRTGRFWASEHAGIAPDILATAKGLSGGLLPFAATLTSTRLFEGFWGDASRAFYYGHTYCGNPLGARVAKEVLDVYDAERVLAGVPARAEKLAQLFERLASLPGVTNARSLGMCAALDLAEDAHYLGRAGWRVFDAALRRGVYMRPLGSVIYLVPPLNIPWDDLDELTGRVEESVREVLASS